MKSLNWKKLPSVTRPGKSFYRVEIEHGPTWIVRQSFLTGFWEAGNNHNLLLATSDFKTAKAAKSAVNRIY